MLMTWRRKEISSYDIDLSILDSSGFSTRTVNFNPPPPPLPPESRIYAPGNLVNIGSGNGLSPVPRQAIIWTIANLLSNP